MRRRALTGGARIGHLQPDLVGVEPARSADVIETVNYLAERLGAEVIVAHVAVGDARLCPRERE